jgi:hypothetical protein
MKINKPQFIQELQSMDAYQNFKRFMDELEAARAEAALAAAREAGRAIGLIGSLTSTLFKEDGRVLVLKADNLIVNTGWTFISDAIGNSGSRPACMGYIAVGTGVTAAAAAQTALVTESTRIAATFSKPTTNQLQFTATFAAGVATGAITEAGVFNAASAGIMLDRVVFSVINKASGDSLTETFTFTMS